MGNVTVKLKLFLNPWSQQYGKNNKLVDIADLNYYIPAFDSLLHLFEFLLILLIKGLDTLKARGVVLFCKKKGLQ